MKNNEALSMPMNPSQAVITAQSERQVMDWSLVLLSQGIEAFIWHAEEPPYWRLLVHAADYSRAMDAIRQYRLENRRWVWQREFAGERIAFHWGAALICLFLVFVYAWDADRHHQLREAGMMNNTAVSQGEWWRLFTPILLHADGSHLAMNLTVGFIVLGLAMGRYGSGHAVLAAFLAGVAGNGAGYLFYSTPYQGLGASGMVMGALGMISVQSLFRWSGFGKPIKPAIAGLLAGVMLFVLWRGFDPRSDVLAHAGGFIAGALLGGMLCLVPEKYLQHDLANFLSGILAAGLVVLTWGLALS